MRKGEYGCWSQGTYFRSHHVSCYKNQHCESARVPECARQAPHSSQFSSTDWQIIGKTNANTENTQVLKNCENTQFVLTKCRYKYKSAVRRYICHKFHQQLVTGQQFAKQKGWAPDVSICKSGFLLKEKSRIVYWSTVQINLRLAL